MEVFNGPYYRYGILILQSFGTWPHLNNLRKNISCLIFSVAQVSVSIPLIIGAIVQFKINLISTVDNLMGLGFMLGIYMRYVTIYIFDEQTKRIYEQIAVDWQTIIEADELNILHRHSKRGKSLAMTYGVFVVYSMTAFFVCQYSPLLISILDRNTTINPIRFSLHYIFIDEAKYHYGLLTFHILPVVFCTGIFMAGFDGTCIMIAFHICGLFNIICFRLENLGKNIDNNIKSKKQEVILEKMIFNDVYFILNRYKSTIKIFEEIQEIFNVTFLVMLSFFIVATSLIIFAIMQHLNEPIQLLQTVGVLVCVYVSLYLLLGLCEHITTNSEKMFISAYCGYWYNLPLKSRKLVSLIILRCSKPCYMTALGLFDMNIQTFTRICKAGASYSAVLLQFSNK